MPRMTPAEYATYQANHSSSGAQLKPIVCHEPMAAQRGEGENTASIHVRITSFRVRLIDPDNLCPKYFIDCLRYAGIIRNDRAEDIILEVKQFKVKNKPEERTEIEIG